VKNNDRLSKKDIAELIKPRLNEIKQKYFISNIRLFGSFINGKQNKESDVDFLVDFSSPISIFKHVNLIYELEGLVGRKVDAVSIKALKPLMKEQIVKDAIDLEKL